MNDLNFTHQVIVPVRKTAGDAAEQVTQLLFGDVVEVLDEDRQWRRIRNLADGYEGWADRKLLLDIDRAWLDTVAHWEFVHERSVQLQCSMHGMIAPQPLTMGCRVPVFKGQEDAVTMKIQAGAWAMEIPREHMRKAMAPGFENLLAVSSGYMGAPYLWGGKTAWGIDCSGFTQMVFAACGISLPRDAYQQADALGETISFGNHEPGDLAFFQNEKGRITHVGMVMPGGKIRHASGYVHDAWLRREGIFSPITQLQTHTLSKIKRFA